MIGVIVTSLFLVAITNVACNSIIIVEEPVNGSEIKSLSEYLQSLVTNKTSSFRLIEDNDLSRCLFVDPHLVTVIVRKRIDRESLCQFDLIKCIVKLKFIMIPLYQSISRDVEIEDINDNPPSWPQQSISRNITEFEHLTVDLPLIYVDKAYDPDSSENGRVTYFLKEADTVTESRNFQIELSSATTNRLKIYPTKVIDREEENSFNLVLLAVDNGFTRLTGSLKIKIQVLDVNDNSPIFKKQIYGQNILSELSMIGTKVLTVLASDKDSGENGRICYRIDDIQGSKFFKIDEKGLITVNRKLDYDKGVKKFRFMVMAMDSAPEPYRKSGSCDVTIDIKDENDEKPEIVVHVTSRDPITNMAAIKENELTANMVLAHVQVKDPDFMGSDRVKCSLNEIVKIRLEETSINEYQLIMLSKYDREEQSQEIVIITCLDQAQNEASASIVFKIIDENDNTPTFSRSYHFSIQENSTNPHMVVGSVLAIDRDEGKNSLINYEIDGEENRYFTIDSRGRISTKHPLDREEVERFNLTILAKDGGQPSRTGSTKVVVDVLDINDWTPEFNASSYEFSIEENSKIGSTVGFVTASDRDLDSKTVLRYSISSEAFNYRHHFRIVKGRIVSSSLLDREEHGTYNLVVTVEDSGLPFSLSSSVSVKVVLIDVNDNSPIFLTLNHTKFYMQMSESVGHEIGFLRANDLDYGDNAAIDYAVIDGNLNKHLALNPSTGKLNLAHQMARSGEKRLVIEACDRGSPRLCSRPLWIVVKVTQPPVVDNTEMQQHESQTDSKTYIFIICLLVILLFVVLVLIICAFLFKDRICIPVPRANPCNSDLRIDDNNSTEKTMEVCYNSNGNNELMLMPNYPNTASPRNRNYEPALQFREPQTIHSDYQSLTGGSPQYNNGTRFNWDVVSIGHSYNERADPLYSEHRSVKGYYSPPPAHTYSSHYNTYNPLRFRTTSYVARLNNVPKIHKTIRELAPRGGPLEEYNSLYNVDRVTSSHELYRYQSLRKSDLKASFV